MRRQPRVAAAGECIDPLRARGVAGLTQAKPARARAVLNCEITSSSPAACCCRLSAAAALCSTRAAFCCVPLSMEATDWLAAGLNLLDADADQALDLARRLGAALGQRPHLASHDGKAAA